MGWWVGGRGGRAQKGGVICCLFRLSLGARGSPVCTPVRPLFYVHHHCLCLSLTLAFTLLGLWIRWGLGLGGCKGKLQDTSTWPMGFHKNR